jgi:hypothetical protein
VSEDNEFYDTPIGQNLQRQAMTTTDTPTTLTDPLADALSELERNAIPWGSPFDNGVDPTTLKSVPIPPPSQYLVRAVDIARLHAVIRDGQVAQAAAVAEEQRLRAAIDRALNYLPDGGYSAQYVLLSADDDDASATRDGAGEGSK